MHKRHILFYQLLEREPKIVEENAIPNHKVMRLAFDIAAIYSKEGKPQGLMGQSHKQNSLIIIAPDFIRYILDTSIGWDKLREGLEKELANFN